MKGIKYDDGKLPWEILPWKEIEDVVKVMQFGAKKYEVDNWKGVSTHRYIGACFRHLVAWVTGESNDKETGCSHLAHACCCVLFMMWKEKSDKADS